LYDNQIETIENLNFATILQYLYLTNNLIKEIPELTMTNLTKLFLDDNEILVVSGLTECVKLAELHVARQRLPTFTSLKFEPQTLQRISKTLQVLEISGCNITTLNPFLNFFNLRKILCKDNSIVEMGEVEQIVSLPYLEEANFIGNPCYTFFKYRDICIGASSECLSILDDVEILKHHQIAIKGLMKLRRNIGSISKFNVSNSVSSPNSPANNEE
jgi:hypothetical protein